MSSWYLVSRDHQPVRQFLMGTTEAVVIGKYHGNLELRFFDNTDVRIFATAHPSLLMMFA